MIRCALLGFLVLCRLFANASVAIGAEEEPAPTRRGAPENPRKSERPPTEADLEQIARDVLGPKLERYEERGFKEYEFGTTRKQVEALSPLKHSMGSWWENGKRHQLLFADDRLVGVAMMFVRNDNEVAFEKFKDLFGRSNKQNVESFAFNAGPDARIDGVRVTYHFPQVVAETRIRYIATVLGNRIDKREEATCSVFDRTWVLRQLHANQTQYAVALACLKKASAAVQSGAIDAKDLPEYADAETAPHAVGSVNGYHYVVKSKIGDPKPPPGVPHRDWFLAVAKQDARTPEHPRGTIFCTLRLGNLPVPAPSPLAGSSLQHLVTRANSQQVQEYFPPRGDTISVVTRKNAASKSYEWLTKEFLRVQVNADDSIVVIRRPEE